MQNDILPKVPPSGGYENLITAKDMISRYAFAYPLSNLSAVNTAENTIDMMTKYNYFPTLIMTGKGSVLVSHVIHEKAEILGKKIKQATTKHAKTIELPQRAHATFSTTFKKASVEYRKQRHKYLPITSLNYSAT